MVLSSIQKDIIFQYRDKTYICSILCQQTSDWYYFLKTIINIPLILMSTSLSIINSLNIDNLDMRIPNIVINASFALILSLINNFNISEKQANFRSLHLKYTKLTHFIEDKITNELENCTKEDIRKIINDYDAITDNLEYPYPGFIRLRVKKRFFGKKTLPNILNCEIVFVNKEDDTPLIKYLNSNEDKKISILIEKNKFENEIYSNDLNNEFNNDNYNISTKSLFGNNRLQREDSSKSLFGNNRLQREDSLKSLNNNDKKISILIEKKPDQSQKEVSPMVRNNISPMIMTDISNNKDFSHIKYI
jgi:hypothetical protein